MRILRRGDSVTNSRSFHWAPFVSVMYQKGRILLLLGSDWRTFTAFSKDEARYFGI